MHSCRHKCTPVYKSAAETRMNSRQSELRKTEMESKEIQYQMQYFPMHYNVQGVNDGQKSSDPTRFLDSKKRVTFDQLVLSHFDFTPQTGGNLPIMPHCYLPTPGSNLGEEDCDNQQLFNQINTKF